MHCEWARSRYWLIYFLNNRHQRAAIDWQNQSDVRSDREVLRLWLKGEARREIGRHQIMVWQAIRECGADPAFIQALRLLGKEQHHHLQLLNELRTRSMPPLQRLATPGSSWSLSRHLGLRFGFACNLIDDLLELQVLATVHAMIGDPPSRAAIEQMIHDRRAHVAFVSERLTMGYADFNFVRRNLRRARLRIMFGALLLLTLARFLAVVSGSGRVGAGEISAKNRMQVVSQFLVTGWREFQRQLEAMVPYRRDMLLARLMAQQQRPYDEAELP